MPVFTLLAFGLCAALLQHPPLPENFDDVVGIGQREALGHVQLVAVVIPCAVKPGHVIEALRVDNEGVSVPAPIRPAHPSSCGRARGSRWAIRCLPRGRGRGVRVERRPVEEMMRAQVEGMIEGRPWAQNVFSDTQKMKPWVSRLRF